MSSKLLAGAVAACVVTMFACGGDEDGGSSTQPTDPPVSAVATDAGSVTTTTRESSAPPATVAPTTEAVQVGTRENPVPIGQPASVGEGWTAVVNSVNLNANDAVAAANQFNEPPIEGSVYVLANVTVTYDGDAPSDSSGVRFQALGASNTAIDSGGSSFATPPDPYESFTEVFEGGSLSGDVVFEVPTSDVENLVLIGHAYLSFDNDERAFFATR